MEDNVVVIAANPTFVEIEEASTTITVLVESTPEVVEIHSVSQDVTIVEVADPEVQIVAVEEQVISVLELAPGPKGDKGDTGDTGGFYEHSQASPWHTWEIDHNLGYRPNVEVLDNEGRTLIGDIGHPTINRTIITFSALVSGVAILS